MYYFKKISADLSFKNKRKLKKKLRSRINIEC